MSDHYDSPWKDVLQRFFPHFMQFFFPEAHRDIDWDQGWESCDQELQQIVRDAELGKRLADKVMKVWLLDGDQLFVYAHIEVQGQHDGGFPKRMFVYNYRLYDRYERPVISLAILGDDSPGWRPDTFGYAMWGCRMGLRFPVVKLRDYEARWQELEASRSPFAIVVMAHLKTLATRPDQKTRLQWKLRLYRRLHDGGHERQDALDLLRFLDWIMKLSPELDQRFQHRARKIDAEKKMQYVTSFERHALKKGLQQGMEKGMEKVLRRQLKRRFDRIPQWVEKRLAGADRQELETWTDRVIEAETLEEVFA